MSTKLFRAPRRITKRQRKRETHFKCQITSHWFACSQLNLNARYSLAFVDNRSALATMTRHREKEISSRSIDAFLSLILLCVFFFQLYFQFHCMLCPPAWCVLSAGKAFSLSLWWFDRVVDGLDWKFIWSTQSLDLSLSKKSECKLYLAQLSRLKILIFTSELTVNVAVWFGWKIQIKANKSHTHFFP